MTLDHVTAQHESLADYAILLAEGAVVLSALAASRTPGGRAEELADLRAIHAEGAELTGDGLAAAGLHHMFEAMLSAGADLALTTETPPQVLSRIQGVQRLAQSIAIALDEPVGVCELDRLNSDLKALDPVCGPAVDLDAAIALAAEVVRRVL